MKHAPSSEAGFSLVEIMVALFIVGLTTSFVVLSMPKSPTPLAEAEDQFRLAVSDARRSALVSGEVYGLDFEKGEILKRVFRRGEWQAATQERRISSFEYPDDVSIRFPKNKPKRREFSLETKKDEVEIEPPPIWFDPSGLAETQSVELIWKGKRISFEFAPDGRLLEQGNG